MRVRFRRSKTVRTERTLSLGPNRCFTRVLSVCAWLAILTGQATGQSLLAPAGRSAHRTSVIEVRYREAADVFEMLDQVSAWWPDYVEPAYRKSWIAAQRIRPDDSTYFAQYAQLRERHIDRRSQAGSGVRRAGSGIFSADAAATADLVAAAFYESNSLVEAFDRLRGVLSQSEITFLMGFYAHFDARTSPLAAATRAATSASRAATAETLADTAVVRYVGEVAALFVASSSDSAGRPSASEEPLSVLYVSWPDSMQTFATPHGRALILRVRPQGGEIVNSADVVVHEAVHVFAAGMPEAQKSTLTGALLDGCAVPAGVRRLAILEEPIATALGNIEFRRRFMPKRFAWGRRWYGDAWVDVYARLLHPLLADRATTGRRLDVAFAREAAGLCTALVAFGAGAR